MTIKRILCFWDSNTWGYIPGSGERFSKHSRWPGVMAGLLGDSFEIVEEGLNGRTTVWDDPIEGDKSGIRHLPICLESHRPLDLVILILGTNDLKHRFSLTAFDIAAGAERLVQYAHQFGTSVALISPPPVQPIEELKEMFQGAETKSNHLGSHYSIVAERNSCAFLDLASILTVDPLDGIHYSSASHQILGKKLAEIVKQIFPEGS